MNNFNLDDIESFELANYGVKFSSLDWFDELDLVYSVVDELEKNTNVFKSLQEFDNGAYGTLYNNFELYPDKLLKVTSNHEEFNLHDAIVNHSYKHISQIYKTVPIYCEESLVAGIIVKEYLPRLDKEVNNRILSYLTRTSANFVYESSPFVSLELFRMPKFLEYVDNDIKLGNIVSVHRNFLEQGSSILKELEDLYRSIYGDPEEWGYGELDFHGGNFGETSDGIIKLFDIMFN